MCEECRYAHQDEIRNVVDRARPDQIQRLLRDIRRLGPDLGRDPGDGGRDGGTPPEDRP